ncbi:acyl-CoA dehydrogenase family protein [Rhizobium rhizogenes]|uniref:acyl-CoA dehydrogenase family protein n=1 Tax=Rhizobium rhizogenes TaxID=359 RepID=UPI001571E66F|nr:acyl-CoA dehydrogenase family protein [Rhizobium rhizogenes]NTI32929.1 oxidoreductase [Rhizobium rhizogenes]
MTNQTASITNSCMTVDTAELLRRAQALVPTLKERAFKTAEAGKVLDETVQDILAAQLNRIGVPSRFGGFDIAFDTHHKVAMELARACGSTAWCYSLWGAHTYWLAYFDPQAQEEVFADGPDVITSSASFSVQSNYKKVPGGFYVSGHWRFVSGCDHAQWVFAIVDGPDGKLDAIIPRSAFKIIDGTWAVSGLQGTGSKDIVVDGVFVPDYRTQFGGGELYNVEHAAQRPPMPYHAQRRYTVPKYALVVWDLVAPTIGMAQGAVDEIVERMKGTHGGPRSAESEVVQNKISESSAEIDAAKALLHSDFQDAQDKGENSETFTDVTLARYARDRAYAAKLAVNAADRMFEMAGARALSLKDPLQRIARDVQAAVHRDGLIFDFASQPFARALFGMDPGFSVLRKGEVNRR